MILAAESAAAALTWQGWFTLAVMTALIVGLVRYAHLADIIFVGGLAIFGCAGIVSPKDALAGFMNEGVLTIGALFIVGRALVDTGILEAATQRVLGNVQTATAAVGRVVGMTMGFSAFLNNTTVVAMGMPALVEWARKRRIPVSRLLLPLSYASILGGVCTLIGTSTNLVVHGQMKQSGVASLATGIGMWELSAVGVPLAILGGLYLVLCLPSLLPDRREFIEQLGEHRREFLTELVVAENCPLIGKSVQQAGLRGLPGLFLIEISRGEDSIAPVEPDERLRAGDRLIFTGVVTTIADLTKIPGLIASPDISFEFTATGGRRRLSEAVISASSPLIGQGIREANFRGRYDAVVIAVHRNGRRLAGKIGDIELEAGDTLLVETGDDFFTVNRHNPDFYLVSDLGESSRMRLDRAGVALLIAGLLIAAYSMPEMLPTSVLPAGVAEWISERRALLAMLAAGLVVVSRCVSAGQARLAIDWPVLITVAASLGVGKAMQTSGLAAWIAEQTMQAVGGFGPIAMLAAVYFLTWVLTELMSNNAAAALMFPIGVAAAAQAGVEPRPFVIAIAIAASASFVLPAGYQTHLMVFGPGGYRTSDFIRVGAPLALLWMVGALLIIPRVWPLTAVQ